ncbi:MAG TPA: class I SAM-dependent methyltransferase [Thermoleophilaceae bacterium]|nr:class I SAM-dependent methyltransferase [Thermoleophilaceae bacterium]
MSLWGRIFAAGYDTFQSRMEESFFGDIRREMLAGASGSVVEIGAGTGVNLQHYPRSVERLVCTEPEEPMAKQLRRKAADSDLSVEIVEAPAEALPFEDDSFDTAVATLVLCTVTDPVRALSEIDRVLRPGGRFIFVEHVRSEDPGLARWQDRLHPLWVRFGHGCNCNRPTLQTIEASPLDVQSHRDGRIPKAPPIVRPLVTGVATAR